MTKVCVCVCMRLDFESGAEMLFVTFLCVSFYIAKCGVRVGRTRVGRIESDAFAVSERKVNANSNAVLHQFDDYCTQLRAKKEV